MGNMIAITGGGTGGHLSIAKSLGFACKKLEIPTLYIGGTKGQDKQWFENNDIFTKTIFLDSTPVVNQRGVKKLSAFMQNINEALKARKIMKELNVSACISVGGFCAASGGFGALFGNIPLFIHEQNAAMGSLNKLLKPFCKQFFCSFSVSNATYTSYPVNDSFFDTQRVRDRLQTMLFLGGSQGAKAINDFALRLTPLLAKKGINIIHQAGKLDYDRVKGEYEALGFKIKGVDSINKLQASCVSKKIDDTNIDCFANASNDEKIDSKNSEIILFDFSKEIDKLMQMSDFCVSRAGASSLWELVSNGLPALFIPYPFAAKNHQYYNAKSLSENGYAMLYTQDEIEKCDVEKMLNEILSCDLSHISQNLIKQINRDGALEIIKMAVETNKS